MAKKYLELKLKGEIVEGRPEPAILGRKPKTDIKSVLDALARAKKDERIAAVLLKLERPELGWARAQNIREALANFRSGGRRVFAFFESGGNLDYFLGSAADAIFVPPTGNVDLTGLRVEVVFFKGALDRLGIKAELDRVGEYKSAAELFTRNSMSETFREEMDALLDDLYSQFVAALAEGRGLSVETISRAIDRGPYTAREAEDLQLVDKLLYEDELEKELETRLGFPVKAQPWERYRVREPFILRFLTRRWRPRIALIHATGIIASGESRRAVGRRPITGAETLVELIRSARDNKRVRAVVLRIDSPGGSAVASDIVWRAITEAKRKKPFIVSFGDTAASGGYYIGMAGDYIIAEPGTLTGSIGVIGGKFVVRSLLERLGLSRQAIMRGQHAAFHSPLQEFSREEREKLAEQMRSFYYQDFISKLAESRRLRAEDTQRAAQGRVWTGRQGKSLGLVDELGGLDHAIEKARSAAYIPPEQKVNVVYYYKKMRLRDIIPVSRLLLDPLNWMQNLPHLAGWLELIELCRSEDVLAIMPFEVEIK